MKKEPAVHEEESEDKFNVDYEESYKRKIFRHNKNDRKDLSSDEEAEIYQKKILKPKIDHKDLCIDEVKIDKMLALKEAVSKATIEKQSIAIKIVKKRCPQAYTQDERFARITVEKLTRDTFNEIWRMLDSVI